MNITLQTTQNPPPSPPTITAPPSKSDAHRILILSALSKAADPIVLSCRDSNADMDATVGCLAALGADIRRTEDGYSVIPINRFQTNQATEIQLDAGESGSTLRFLIPVIGALGKSVVIKMHGRLPYRPLYPLDAVLTSHGMRIRHDSNDETLLHLSGQLLPGDYEIDGSVSSQFISGLLFALPLLDAPSVLQITGNIASAPYIRLTLSVLNRFGYVPQISGDGTKYSISPFSFHPCQDLRVEGDWSGAAFLLCAGAMRKTGVTVCGLSQDSIQGDKRILEVLTLTGCTVTAQDDRITVLPPSDRPLSPFSLNADAIPDLVPPMSALAAACHGTSVISGCGRLKIKESDRLSATANLLAALGGSAAVLGNDDILSINGTGVLSGGAADGCNDHRMVMSAALCALISQNSVTVSDAEAIRKSYPGFFSDFSAFGVENTERCPQ